ncbi:hypothetical protein KCP70_16595 [Salmonella enterica subsp. enterica]|nr:hypothetical protein KCP70_16595 [Salmonella enterica subsp. enterica]
MFPLFARPVSWRYCGKRGKSRRAAKGKMEEADSRRFRCVTLHGNVIAGATEIFYRITTRITRLGDLTRRRSAIGRKDQQNAWRSTRTCLVSARQRR